MPTAHLIIGATGAGKTTYALELARREAALRFTVDEWMRELFWVDAPEPIAYAWALERVERCERHALALAAQIITRKNAASDIILDFGFFGRQQRQRLRDALSAQGWNVRLHYLNVPAGERWRRVSQRNDAQGETFQLEVTRGMFDFCEDLFELPDAAELAGAVRVGE